MQHGDVVGIKPLPSGKMVHEHRARGAGAQQRPADPVFTEQPRELLDPAVTPVEGIAIKIGAPIDHRRNPREDQKAAEIEIVEDRTGHLMLSGGRKRRRRSDPVYGAHHPHARAGRDHGKRECA